MTVGSIQTTVTPPLASGIFEALLEKAERERDEAREAAAKWESSSDAMERAGAEQARRADENREWAVRLERERDEARKSELAAISERERWRMQAEEKWGMRRELEELPGVKDTQCDEQFAKGLAVLRDLVQNRDEARKENEEQARLLGMGGEREARLITERDHYKQAIEEVSTSIDDWLNSLIQEPSLDFIKAIKAWADKKLNNG